MMYIEDLLYKLNYNVRYASSSQILMRDLNIINSLNYNCQTKSGLTIKQQALAIKLLKKYQKEISAVTGQDISSFIESPQFKLAARLPIQNKTITIGDYLGNLSIMVKFPYDTNIVEIIHNHKQKYYPIIGNSHAHFDFELKSWILEINEINMRFMLQLRDLGFEIDECLHTILDQVDHIIKNIKDHIPYLSADEDGYRIINASNTVPPVSSNNLLVSLIHARRYGITDWDDTIQNHIDRDPAIKRIENFFQNTKSGIIETQQPLKDWTPMLAHCQRVLFVIPGGIEMAYTAEAHDVLLCNGYKSTEISVIFRTCNKRNPIFNQYVNHNNLNNPLSDQTRAVMISRALPKPLVTKNFNFDLIICRGIQYSNHRLKKYLYQQHNAIRITHQS